MGSRVVAYRDDTPPDVDIAVVERAVHAALCEAGLVCAMYDDPELGLATFPVDADDPRWHRARQLAFDRFGVPYKVVKT